jgi:hypothetical protein
VNTRRFLLVAYFFASTTGIFVGTHILSENIALASFLSVGSQVGAQRIGSTVAHQQAPAPAPQQPATPRQAPTEAKPHEEKRAQPEKRTELSKKLEQRRQELREEKRERARRQQENRNGDQDTD